MPKVITPPKVSFTRVGQPWLIGAESYTHSQLVKNVAAAGVFNTARPFFQDSAKPFNPVITGNFRAVVVKVTVDSFSKSAMLSYDFLMAAGQVQLGVLPQAAGPVIATTRIFSNDRWNMEYPLTVVTPSFGPADCVWRICYSYPLNGTTLIAVAKSALEIRSGCHMIFADETMQPLPAA